MSAASLAGKVALVTGASSGIGRAVATLLASRGASVALTARNTEALESLRSEIESSGGTAAVFPGDVTDDASVAEVVASATAHFKRLDILVNNAGVLQGGTTDAASMANWDFNMSTNARAPFLFLTSALPHLKEAGAGSVVNVSSVNGQQSFGGCVSYCASKAALDMMTRCASIDLAQYGIRVNAVSPGVTMTNLQKAGGLSDEAYDAFIDRSVRVTHPLAESLGRCASAEEIAESVCFFASPQSSFTTGAVLAVDGGRVNLGAR